MLDKLQKQVCRTIGPTLASYLEPLIHCRAANLSLFNRYCFGRCLSQLAELIFPNSCGRSTRYSDRFHGFFGSKVFFVR